MLCAACGNDGSRVLKTEQSAAGIERMRQCRTCGHVWRTLETELKAGTRKQEGKAA